MNLYFIDKNFFATIAILLNFASYSMESALPREMRKSEKGEKVSEWRKNYNIIKYLPPSSFVKLPLSKPIICHSEIFKNIIWKAHKNLNKEPFSTIVPMLSRVPDTLLGIATLVFLASVRPEDIDVDFTSAEWGDSRFSDQIKDAQLVCGHVRKEMAEYVKKIKQEDSETANLFDSGSDMKINFFIENLIIEAPLYSARSFEATFSASIFDKKEKKIKSLPDFSCNILY